MKYLKTDYEEFLLEFISMNKDVFNEYMKDMPLNKSISLLKRGNYFVVKSDTNKSECINIPLIFVLFDKYKNIIKAFDKDEKIYEIDINKISDCKIELI